MCSGFAGTARVDAILSPVALRDRPEPPWRSRSTCLAIGPLVWLLQLFSQDRRERYAQTLELHRAYRGTVMLLSDVVESEDDYTAQHCRSVVDLVNACCRRARHRRTRPPGARVRRDAARRRQDRDPEGDPQQARPRSPTSEFEVMKTHTIEGQFMLDRVGGLLGRVGEIVRSCHERWDGKGYPDGLIGDEIPYHARIVFCCDAYNAMTTDRVYRKAMGHSAATRGAAGPLRHAVRPVGRRRPRTRGSARPGRVFSCRRGPCCPRRSSAVQRGARHRQARLDASSCPSQAPRSPSRRDHEQRRGRSRPRSRASRGSRTADLRAARPAPGEADGEGPRSEGVPDAEDPPDSASGTSPWTSSRSYTSSSPLPKPAASERDERRADGGRKPARR